MSLLDTDDSKVDVSSAPKKRSAGRAVLSVRDLTVPLVCVAILALLYLAVQAENPTGIEATIIGPDAIRSQTSEHLLGSVVIAVLVIVLAVPLGILVTRRSTRFLSPFVLAVANVGQAAPSVGLIAIAGLIAVGFWSVVLILTLYAMLAVLRNTIVGLEQVDANTLDAARGMGMSAAGVLFRVELPLAIPVIAAGARTALVLAIATVPIGAYIGFGGLGTMLIGGFKTDRTLGVVVAAVLIAVLALLIDWIAGIVERALTPRGIR